LFLYLVATVLLAAGMAKTIVAKIGTGRRVVGPVTLCAVSEIDDARHHVAGAADIAGISVIVVIVGGVVVVISGIAVVAAVAITQRTAGRQTRGEAETATEAIMVMIAAEASAVSTLRELRAAAAGEITAVEITAIQCASLTHARMSATERGNAATRHSACEVHSATTGMHAASHAAASYSAASGGEGRCCSC